jgi:alkylation response protein AidB-like acyl-CoA dehydrogenase
MSIAITEDHRALADTVAAFAADRKLLAAARSMLEGATDRRPPAWDEMAALGWLGLHLPESYGGSGFGLPELVVVIEQLGRVVAPGAFVPTVAASAAIDAAGSPEQRARWLPGLADGSVTAAVALGGDLVADAGRVRGDAGVVLGGAVADLLVVSSGHDLVVLEAAAPGVVVEAPPNIDPSRPSARIRVDAAIGADQVIPGARALGLAFARTLFAAEATGIARAATDSATAYAKERQQFGRPIGTFQAVKHHCANMLVASEVAAAATWDAARAASSGGDQFLVAAAIAAALAIPAAAANAQLNIQVHGGIGFTWEHDAHLLLRRAIAVAAVIDAGAAAEDVTALAARGVKRAVALDLPPEAEALRAGIRQDAEALAALSGAAQREQLIDTGYVMPHWPRPWGRDAGAVEQLVIDEEFAAAGVDRPQLGITGWVMLTITQHGTEDQIERWVRPTLAGQLIWCQLFSEPDAGSDAAGVKTRGTRVEGGFLINGQKVWTSGAHVAHMGLATVRTDPEAEKHAGVTTVAIDMHAPGVQVRPLRQVTGGADFNEVFFTDVFVPDTDVVGPANAGWTVARATLGNERVSIGAGAGGGGRDMSDELAERAPFLSGGPERVGRYLALQHAARLLNLRSAQRAVSGAGPGPEGNVTKLLLAEQNLELAAILAALAGGETAFTEGPGASAAMAGLASRALSIAGGTSEITRNQIGERILGLPRDPNLR